MNVARKLTVALVIGIVVVHAGAAAYRIERERNLFEQDTARDARVLGRVLGHAVERAWLTYGEDEALSIVEHATERESHVDIRWVRLTAEPGHPQGPKVPAAELAALATGEPVVVTVDSDEGGTDYTYVPVAIDGLDLGAIEVADSLGDERNYMMRSLVNTLVSMAVLVTLCAALSWLLGVRLIGRPVRLIVAQARAIGRGEFDHRLRLPIRDELGELAAEIDLMCDQLQAARDQLETETQSRVAAVEQLRHADRLKTVGTLASGIAHELGTPINVIEGHATLLREEAPDHAPTVESAEVIARQCKRMASIIRGLLDFARRGGSTSATTNAVGVVEQSLAMVAPLARKQNVEIEVVSGTLSEAPVAIAFEPLQQVLTNLLVNSLHAMPDGGKLTVEIGPRRAKPPTSGPAATWMAIAVRDEGAGMSRETMTRVFEPFFTTKDVGEGTGLGLAVAYGIIEDHGGWIDVHSELGAGTTFTVYLPKESRT